MKKTVVSFLVLFVVLVGRSSALTVSIPNTTLLRTFDKAPAAEELKPFKKLESALESPLVSKYRFAKISPGVLTEKSASGGMALKKEIPFDLFDDTQFIAQLKQVKTISPGVFVAQGTLKDVSGGYFVAVSRGDGITADIRTTGAIYEIRNLGKGIHVVKKLDPKAFPADDAPKKLIPKFAAFHLPVIKQLIRGTSTVDVLTVYTKEARDSAGGTNTMKDLIDLAVAETNAAYENSNIPLQIRLAGAREINYVESKSFDTDLDRLTNTADGYMDDVHALRDQLQADIVTLFISDGGDACGIGWILDADNYKEFAPKAFNVVDVDCIPNYSFAHELGHNMGASHDRAHSSGTIGMYDYSYGYQDPGNKFRTVMAYDCAAGCPRVPYFSDPNVSFDGSVTGVAGSENNAETLRNTRAIVASFRGSSQIDWAAVNRLAGLAATGTQNAASSLRPAVTLPSSAAIRVNLPQGELVIGDKNDTLFTLGAAANDKEYVQTFVAAGGSIRSVAVRMSKQGNPSFLPKFELKKADDTLLAVADFDRTTITPAPEAGWTSIQLRRPVEVVSGKVYKFVVSVPGQGETKYYFLAASRDSYTQGELTRGGAAMANFDLSAKLQYLQTVTSGGDQTVPAAAASGLQPAVTVPGGVSSAADLPGGEFVIGDKNDKLFTLGSSPNDKTYTQTFVAEGGFVKSVLIRMSKQGTPSFMPKLELKRKDGTRIVNVDIDRGTIATSTDAGWVTVPLDRPTSVTSGEEYTLTVSVPAAGDKNYYLIGASFNSYAGGTLTRGGLDLGGFDLSAKLQYARTSSLGAAASFVANILEQARVLMLRF